MSVRRTCLVGAGVISRAHAEALGTIPSARLAVVVDPDRTAAERLAGAFGASEVHASLDEAIAAAGFDVAHVLVPPPLHAAVATRLLQAGKPVLLEKPMAVSAAECRALAEAAKAAGVLAGVNQNGLFYPAFVKLRRLLDSGVLGRPDFVECTFSMPLRQLAARQFGHWMFREPGNILLEQAVHPLSQVVALAGRVRQVQALAEAPLAIAPGATFHPAFSAVLACERLQAVLRFAVGRGFPTWQVRVVCDDGVAIADIAANRLYSHRRTKWLEAVDGLLSSGRTGLALAGAGAGNALDFGLSALRLKGRSDPFFLGMRESIAAFHARLAGSAPTLEADADFGAHLVEVCEQLRDAALGPPAPRAVRTRPPAPESWDVAVLGGTGFIGAETVRQLVAAGQRVGVMARSLGNLPEVFESPQVALIRGDIRNQDDVARAIGPARVVVNLAHGGAGGGYEAIRAAMVGGAEAIARLSLERKVFRLVHVGSIASLYLGPDAGTITGATPSDPKEAERGDYARAKAVCERMLLEMHAREGLPVVILRPGVVVGAGTPPLHSGLGFFNNDQHVIGWNRGRNPLPFVLVADVAAAIVLACSAAGIEGRTYNLVGDVRPSARLFIADLARTSGRAYRFHPQWPTQLWLEEVAKWLVKRAGGRRTPLPSRRDILSRGMAAPFDCSDAKRDLGWQPVADAALFHREAIAVHAR